MSENVKNEVTVPISGRIDSNSAPAAEAGIRAAITDGADNLVLDAEKLEYISSAGLRILLRLRKEYPELMLINVNSEIYEILDMTGFTEMMKVEKAYRTLSVDGCECIGRGAKGAVYRIDDENIVKVYFDPDALDEIKNEREMAKLALILGVPTAISYEVVRVGENYGSVFELINARSIARILAQEPGNFDLCVKEFAGLLKKIHSIEAPAGKLHDIKPDVIYWVDRLGDAVDEEAKEKLRKLILAVPERLTMLHGDFHPKNIMLQNGEALVIDMDTLATGHPIFELCSVYNALIGFYEYDSEAIEEFQGFDFDLGVRFFYAALSEYLGTTSETKLREVKDKARILSYTRLIGRAVHKGALETEKGRAEIALWKEELIALLETADTLDFSPNELEIEADKANLPEALSFIEELVAPLEPSEKAKMQLELAAEEIFVNIADYAYAPGKGKAKILVETDEEAREAVITFSDKGRPFDPTAMEDPALSLPVGEKTPGGLGIFLTKKLMDGVSYEYRDGKNILKLIKKA
ncbi:MAG: anti-sigma factor antagonist [Clostridia bacterium]|nr:anti-sigma factor antagonist [Clostridia bacterium]